MGKLIFKKSIKVILPVIQALAAGIFAFCMLNIGFWMENHYSFREMSRGFEQTNLFYQQVDQIIQHKIRGQQNKLLFETDGVYDETKEIDIQSFGLDNTTVKDMNTTYKLGDLLGFYDNGGWNALHRAIVKAEETQNNGGKEAGELLDSQSGTLETILPVTGISISECSRWYSDSSHFVWSTYKRLDEVCQEIAGLYQEYTTRQDESWSSAAPSNLLYCIENTATGELYTNAGSDSYGVAVQKILHNEKYSCLFEGQRSFNIMVTNPEHVMNQEASDWFMEERFVNTNERVFLAINTDYPVSDELQVYAYSFEKRESTIWNSLIGAIVAALMVLAGFVLSVLSAGWEEGRITPRLYKIDQIPTELFTGLLLTLIVLYSMVLSGYIKYPSQILTRERLMISLVCASFYLVCWIGVTSLIRRKRTQTLWSNSVGLMLIRTWRQVTASRAASVQLLFWYVVFFILNFTFLLAGSIGIFLILILDLAAFLYLLRDMAGKQRVWDGIHQISKGDLKFKIDTAALQGETYEMAKAVNDMGDGLQEAVDAIVKNERLKAELITNVSHDIKTPLTSIVNYVDLLKRENLEGERVKHYLEVLEQKSQRLKQLTEDLVEASKISSGNIELQLMKMPLQSMVRQAYGEFQERLEERGLTPVWEMEREPVMIMADGRQLWRILENLLGNIYKYAMQDTRVYLEVRREGQQAVLAIKNTSREKLTLEAEELAGRFVRGDKSRSTEGSGLGLSIAQSLVELHGGTFHISLDGDLFKAAITFPIVQEEEE